MTFSENFLHAAISYCGEIFFELELLLAHCQVKRNIRREKSSAGGPVQALARASVWLLGKLLQQSEEKGTL